MKRYRTFHRIFEKAGEPRMEDGNIRAGQEARAMAQSTLKN